MLVFCIVCTIIIILGFSLFKAGWHNDSAFVATLGFMLMLLTFGVAVYGISESATLELRTAEDSTAESYDVTEYVLVGDNKHIFMWQVGDDFYSTDSRDGFAIDDSNKMELSEFKGKSLEFVKEFDVTSKVIQSEDVIYIWRERE